jgi:DNA-3-methyladenine glycosylase II
VTATRSSISDARSFVLRPRPPFRLDLTVWALRRRGRNRVDVWDGRYRRALMVGGAPVAVEIVQDGSPEAPVLAVTASASTPLTEARTSAIAGTVERMLGLGTDLGPFYRLADADPRLRRLKDRFLGVKPPRFPTMFEALANAVANQQLTLEAGIELLNRLAGAAGTLAPGTGARDHAFPDAAAVAALSVPVLRGLGFSSAKAGYLIGIGRAISTGDLDRIDLERMDRADATRALEQLRGIGRWSAEYVLLRGLGRLDVYPGDDVGARNKLRRFLDLPTSPTYPEIVAILAPWYPYAGMVYFHLLLDGLAERGVLEPGAG